VQQSFRTTAVVTTLLSGRTFTTCSQPGTLLASALLYTSFHSNHVLIVRPSVALVTWYHILQPQLSFLNFSRTGGSRFYFTVNSLEVLAPRIG